MKKILFTLLTVFLLLPIAVNIYTVDVFADGAYEVAYIEDDGSFTGIDYYDNFQSALDKMHENPDYVVRHQMSHSPTKIIAMNSGLVYSYPYRRGYSTISLYESINSSLLGTGISTYVAEHYEMTYHSTYYYYESKGFGYVEITLNGFHGYCDLEYCDLVPSKFIVNQIPITLGGEDITGSGEEPFSVKVKQNYYKVVNANGYRDLVFVYHRAWTAVDAGDCIEYKQTIGVAPDFMKEGEIYYSNDGINYFSDNELTNKVGTYYNYYQYLPLRSKTKIDANQMNGFLASHTNNSSVLYNQAQSFINAQTTYGCNAATIFSMAIHEAGWGTSNIAKAKHNLFGWGAYDDATSYATTYDSVEACVNAQMGDNLANYMDVQCSRYFSMSLGNKGGGFILKYASDPYWAEKIASHYYALDKFAGNGNGNLVDYNAYKLALVNSVNTSIKDSPNGNTLYTTANKSGYQKNLIVTPLQTDNGYNMIQLSNPKDDNGVIYPITLPYGTLVEYNFSKSIGYILTSDLIPLNYKEEDKTTQGTNVSSFDPDNIKTLFYIDELKTEDNSSIISIKGFGLIENLDFDNLEVIKHELIFININDVNDVYVYPLQTSKDNIDLNDGHIYDYIHFEGDLDINDLPLGYYRVNLRITNDNYIKDVSIKSSENEFTNIFSNNNSYSIRLFTNKLYNYRFELNKLNSPINYGIINKKRNTPSAFSYDSIEIDDDLNLNIQAISYIPGVNFNDVNNIEFNVYAIKDKDNYIKKECDIVENKFDYNSIIAASYDLSSITFKCSINLSELVGEYHLVTEVICLNDGVKYVDYLEMDNSANLLLPELTKDNKHYSVILTNNSSSSLITCLESE